MELQKLKFQKADLLVIAAVVLIAAVVAAAFLFSANGGEDAIVQIYQDGQLIKEAPLQENATITIPGEYQNVIQIQDSKVAITEANCPGNDCVHIGWISTPGASIVCLPNRLEIRIVGSNGVDLIVG